MERGLQNMSDSHGLCLQDFVSQQTNNGTSNDHLHNHHNLHDSVASAVSVSSAITGLMSTGNNSLNHLPHDTSNQHHHHHHHSIANTPTLHEPLEKLKCKFFLNLFSIPMTFDFESGFSGKKVVGGGGSSDDLQYIRLPKNRLSIRKQF